MRRGRYEFGLSWSTGPVDTIEDFWEPVGTVTTEFSDLRDTRTGDVYPDGARRVTVKVSGGGKRTKVFLGEFAWAEARQFSDDATNELLRIRERVTL